MSFLKSFDKYFNTTINIYRPTVTKNDIWEEEKTYNLIASWIKWLLFLYRQEYEKYTDNKVEYQKTTHKLRVYINTDIKEKDQVEDEDWNKYEVVFTYKVPNLSWEKDHILALLNKLK